MRYIIGLLSIATTCSPLVLAQVVSTAPTTAKTSDVRDSASLFQGSAVDAARKRLRDLETEIHVPVIIETIETLHGKTIDDAAVALARKSVPSGLFVLIAKQEAKIEVLASHRYERILTKAKRAAIRSAFVEKFRLRDFDGGLERGVEAVEAILRKAANEEAIPQSSSSGEVKSIVGVARQLIARDRIDLALGGAEQIIAGAKDQAEHMGIKANIWVVDDGGHPIAFERMDGGRPASVYTALTKAVSAATFRQPSGPIPLGKEHPDPILNTGIQHAATASGGKITTLFGGIPVVVDGQVIGGIGVGGGSGEQDAEIAKAGFEKFLSALKESGRFSRKPSEESRKPKEVQKQGNEDMEPPNSKKSANESKDVKDF
jgi:glc operon protein GlcG